MIKIHGQILLSVQSHATVTSVDLTPLKKIIYDSPLFPKKFLSLFFLGPLHAGVLPTTLQNKQTNKQKQIRTVSRACIRTLFVDAGWGWQPEADVDPPPNTKKSDFG